MKNKKTILALITIIGCTVIYKSSIAFFEDNTLLGKDSNKNGIRDDIENYVDQKTSRGTNQHLSLLQLAKDYQATFLVLNQTDLFIQGCRSIRQSQNCVLDQFQASGFEEIYGIMAEQFSNLIRTKAAAKINAEHFRSVRDVPKNLRSKCCDFLNRGRVGCDT